MTTPTPEERARERAWDELERLIREWREAPDCGKPDTKGEAWNLIADCVIERFDELRAATRNETASIDMQRNGLPPRADGFPLGYCCGLEFAARHVRNLRKGG